MKDRLKIILRVGVLGILIILLIGILNTFFLPVRLDLNNFDTTRSFYSEPKNRIETLFLGSSVGAYGFSPMELYDKYGMCAFTVATQEQSMLASYYWLEETYRLHSDTLKNVVLDVSELRKEATDTNVHAAIDGMKLSSVKLKAAIDYGDGDFSKTLSYILPLTTYHSRWDELEEIDFEKYGMDKANGTRGFCFTLMTYMSTVSSVEELTVLTTKLDEAAEPASFPSEALEYFHKINLFCKEKNISLILVKTPTDNWDSSLNRAVTALADECGIPFLDFNFSPLIDEINYFHPYDSRESKHVNYFGSRKLMDYLGSYLTKNCTVTDIRDNEDFSYMKEQWEKYENDCISQFEINQATDVPAILDAALKRNNTVLITVKDEASTSLTDEQRAFFRDCGLEKLSSLGFRQSYIGIIDKNGVIYEATADDNGELTYETVLSGNTKVSLFSGKKDGKNLASCIINETEEAKNFRGINIVIFNNDTSEVIQSVSFDTYASPVRACYLYSFGTVINDSELAKEYESDRFFRNILTYNEFVAMKNSKVK